MNHIKNAGYQAMVYSSSQLFETVFEINYLHDFDFWVADYSYAPTSAITSVSGNIQMLEVLMVSQQTLI